MNIYIELYNEFRNRAKIDKVDVSEDVVFEMELIKSIEVNIDYILGLVKKYHESNMEDKEVLVTIQKTIMASPDLRNKKDLIMRNLIKDNISISDDDNDDIGFETFNPPTFNLQLIYQPIQYLYYYPGLNIANPFQNTQILNNIIITGKIIFHNTASKIPPISNPKIIPGRPKLLYLNQSTISLKILS